VSTASGAATEASPPSPAKVLAGKVDAVATGRTVVKKVLSVEQSEGDGARVRRSIGRPELRSFDPFLMLDEFNAGLPANFADHPHRGFETVSYLLKGQFAHEDFAGHAGIIGPGDLQWMTAGRGIVHCEAPLSTDKSHGLQLWVNLPAKAKMMEPRYQELPAKDIPSVAVEGVTAKVIAGRALGVESPVQTITPVHYIDFTLAPGAVLAQAIPAGWNSFVYILSGDGYFGLPTEAANGSSASVAADGAVAGKPAGTHSPAHHTVVLSNTGSEDGVVIKAGDAGMHFVLLAGQPLKEPVVQYGPFVMNTQEEIEQAFEDYQEGKNGFERREGWTSNFLKKMRARRGGY
jgi:redox-sensitive bicupin YhaK (pirin superfamily)